MVAEQGLTLPVNHELVLFLEYRPKMGGYNWIYYYVDHATRSLFWVQEWRTSELEGLDEITYTKTPYDISE